LRQAAIDEKLDNYIIDMIENFIVYSNKEEYLDIDPRKWVKAVNLEDLYNFPTDDHTLAIQKSHDILPALIVGFWVPKEETEEFFDDPGVILELYDGSSTKNKNNSFIEKHYAQAFRIKKQERRIPTAFIKISENADLKYNYHIEELLGSKNETKNPCGQLINLRKIKIDKDIPVLPGTTNSTVTGSVGYQGMF